MEALTALQWAKEGYVPNADAVGEERWTNCFHGQKATYYKDNEVHKDSETAKDMLRAKRKEHKKASDKRDEKRKKTWLIERTWKQNGSGSRKVGYRIRMHGGNMARFWTIHSTCAVTAANIAIVILMKHIYPKIVKSYRKPFLIFNGNSWIWL